MQITVKYNVGDQIKRMRGCFATVSHSGSCVEQTLRVERMCQDLKSGDFVTLDDEKISECSRKD